MPDAVQTPASATDAEKLARAEKIQHLIAEIVVLKAREDAIKSLREQRKARLLLLMSQGGKLKCKVTEGTASRTAKRKFLIHDREKLTTLFGPEVLLEQVKVSAAFYDAAQKAKIDIDGAVQVEKDETFKVERARTKEEKERIERIMDETKLEMERRVEGLAERMIRANREAQRRG